MIAPELPTDEAARLESLRALDILDTPPEERFDRITRLASTLFDAPIAYITMVDANRQWFKSSCGLNATETDRDVSFCGHAILEDEALVIPDATADPRFADNPQVVGEPHIRFYVGQPLRGPEGHNVGTLCVADREPRDTVPADDRRALADLATVVEKELNLQDMATLQEKLLEASERAHEAQAESERLLLNILPRPVADQLRNGEADVVDHYPEATVLFADLVAFTPFARQRSPRKVVGVLNDLFCRFDRLVQDRGVEKIKTMGDAYMVAGGLPTPRPDHADAVVAVGRDMLDTLDQFNDERGTDLQLRIGINTGPVTAGVIGTHKFIYDLWGDAVNTAARMESCGVPGRIQVSAATREQLTGTEHTFEPRGPIDVKGKGRMRTFLLASP